MLNCIFSYLSSPNSSSLASRRDPVEDLSVEIAKKNYAALSRICGPERDIVGLFEPFTFVVQRLHDLLPQCSEMERNSILWAILHLVPSVARIKRLQTVWLVPNNFSLAQTLKDISRNNLLELVKIYPWDDLPHERHPEYDPYTIDGEGEENERVPLGCGTDTVDTSKPAATYFYMARCGFCLDCDGFKWKCEAWLYNEGPYSLRTWTDAHKTPAGHIMRALLLICKLNQSLIPDLITKDTMQKLWILLTHSDWLESIMYKKYTCSDTNSFNTDDVLSVIPVVYTIASGFLLPNIVQNTLMRILPSDILYNVLLPYIFGLGLGTFSCKYKLAYFCKSLTLHRSTPRCVSIQGSPCLDMEKIRLVRKYKDIQQKQDLLSGCNICDDDDSMYKILRNGTIFAAIMDKNPDLFPADIRTLQRDPRHAFVRKSAVDAIIDYVFKRIEEDRQYIKVNNIDLTSIPEESGCFVQ